MTIYEKLQKALRAKGIRQATAASRMGITRQRLCRMLSGDRGLPAADFLALCLVLGEDPGAYLFCDELATVRLRLEREACERQNGKGGEQDG